MNDYNPSLLISPYLVTKLTCNEVSKRALTSYTSMY